MEAVAKLRSEVTATLNSVRGLNVRRRRAPAGPLSADAPGACTDEAADYPREFGQVAQQLRVLAGIVAQRRAHELAAGRCRFKRTPAWPRHLARFRRRIEKRAGQLHARGAIERRVMHLRIPRDLSGSEPLDQIEHPERTFPVEQFAVQRCHPGLERGQCAGLRQDDAPEVVVEIDRVVLDPHRAR